MKKMADLFVGLVHYPIYNKRMQVIATAVTNFDIHDIARTARTYDVKKYFLIHPHNAQKEIIQKIIGYWQHGFGRVYNPDRSEALDRVAYVADIAAAIDEVRKMTGKEPVTVTTDARVYPNTISYRKARGMLQNDDRPLLVLFGTGFGMEKETMAAFDYILEPVYGPSNYNHLCVAKHGGKNNLQKHLQIKAGYDIIASV